MHLSYRLHQCTLSSIYTHIMVENKVFKNLYWLLKALKKIGIFLKNLVFVMHLNNFYVGTGIVIVFSLCKCCYNLFYLKVENPKQLKFGIFSLIKDLFLLSDLEFILASNSCGCLHAWSWIDDVTSTCDDTDSPKDSVKQQGATLLLWRWNLASHKTKEKRRW